MLSQIQTKLFNYSLITRRQFIYMTIISIIVMLYYIVKIKNINTPTIITSPHFIISKESSTNEINSTLETKIQCLGPLYNQSCLFTNLYYVDSTFTILTIKGSSIPKYYIRTDAFNLWPIVLNKREFNSSFQLEIFVRNITNPRRFPYVTLYFGQPWHDNIGHALFDGLYSAYVALIRFSPRHLHPFRILAGISECNGCWSEDVYSRFGGLGIIKQLVLNQFSRGRWFVFDEIIMGSGTFCQRCTQSNLQLPGGIELNASRLFRDRMYQQHGFIQSVTQQKYRTSHDILQAYVIDNKRYTENDRKEINDAINEINNYTNKSKLEWPLIHVSYIYYNQVKVQNMSSIQINATSTDSRSPTYELIENDFIAQLNILRKMDIHITGPGTGQMYQTFLSDGSVSINLGGIRPWGLENTPKAYASYLEQHMTSGTPYIKGLYYPINERLKGIKKDEVIKLIRQAGQLILQGFSLPVNPRENLGIDGQLFVEMCEKDKKFCSLVTERLPHTAFACLDTWAEDIVHEYLAWQVGGFENVSCPMNRSLLYELREKYGIKYTSV